MQVVLRAGGKLEIEYTSTADQVAGALREAILQGDIAPGEPLEETACAETFGVSRNTVREAMRELARGGLVVQSRRRPALVTQLTERDVREIFELRRIVEFSAVDIAVEHDADFSDLEAALADLVMLAGTQEWRRLVDADAAFHAAIVGLPHNQRLSRTYETIQGEVRLCLSLTDRWDTDPSDQIRQHRELAEQLIAGDAAGCKQLLKAHIDDAESRVLGVLARAGERGSAEGAAADETAAADTRGGGDVPRRS